MAGFRIATVSSLILLMSVALVQRTCYPFHLHRATLTSFWYLTYIAMIFLPSFAVFSDQPGVYRELYLFSVESVLITVPLGWYLATTVFQFNRSEIDLFFSSGVGRIITEEALISRCWMLLGICVLLTAAYLTEVKTIPLFYLLKNPGEFLEAALLREDSFKLLDSPLSYLYFVVRSFLYPIVILLALGGYLQSRRKKWLVTLWVAIFAGLFFASLSLAKSPVAVIALLVGIFFYLYNNGRINKKVVALFLVLVLIFPVAVMTYAYADESVDSWVALTAIGFRLFYLPAEVVYYYFEVFPNQIPYLHGRSIDKLATLLGTKPFDTTNAVGIYAYPQGLASVSANGAFIADLNADFGIWGVILGGVVAGVIMQSIQIFLLRRRKTIVTLAAFAYVVIGFWFLNSTSLPIVLASDGVIFAVVLVLLLERRGTLTSVASTA